MSTSAETAATAADPGETPADSAQQLQKRPPRRQKKKPLPGVVAADGTDAPTPAVASEAAPKQRRKKRRDPAATAPPGQDAPPPSAVIDSLRSSLEKERQDPLIELNTFDPSRSPKKDIKGGGGGGTENAAFEASADDDDATAAAAAAAPAVRKPRKKRSAAAPAAGGSQESLVEPEVAAAAEAAPAAPAKPRRRVKKQRPATAAAPEPASADTAEEEAAGATVTVEDETVAGAAAATPAKRRTRKKKQPQQQQPGDEPVASGAAGDDVITEQPQPLGAAAAAPPAFNAATVADEGLIVLLRIHRTDQLKNDTHIRHPLVRVHFVDCRSGRYLAKQHPDRKVTSFYESVTFMLPVMTGQCDFRRQGNTLPVWEEQLLLDENFAYVARNPDVVFLFEVLDMLSVAAIQNNRLSSPEAGWYRIAWAFLKPQSASGRSNCGRKVRLQLFEALPLRESEQTDPEVPYLFHWYQGRARIPYPSTLYVTVEEFAPNRNNLQDAGRLRSRFPFEQEGLAVGDLVDGAEVDDADGKAGGRRVGGPEFFQRVPGQLCKIPNRAARTLPSGTHGCSALRFSPDGRWLAAACRNAPVEFPVLLFAYGLEHQARARPDFALVGHAGIVYDLGWSRKSHLLVSASGDCSARVWQLANKQATPHKQLVHPAFVYCAQFHPQSSSLVATGCFDRIIRVWSIFEAQCEVVWQLDGHRSHVNAIVFEAEGRYAYSGDASGQLGVWRCPYTAGTDRPGVAGEWTLASWMDLPELKDKCITCLSVHPSGTRVLVHTRDSSLRMVHVRGSQRGYVVMDYMGHANSRENLRSCISPCGAFVITGSEDGDAYVYNADSGDVVATYRQVNLSGSVSCVDYHPLDNALAFSSLSHSAAVLLYQYDAGLARRDGHALMTRSGALVSVGDTVQELEASRLRQSMPVLEEVDRLKAMQRSTAGASAGGERKSRMAQDRLDSVLLSTATAGASLRRSLAASSTLPQVTTLLPGALESTTPRHLQPQTTESTDIGRHGQLDTSKPRLTLTLDGANRASFKIDKQKRPAAAAAAAAAAGDVPSPRQAEIVIAILDYKAARSDEISFFKGQRIRVIHKDSQSWWLGELEVPLPGQEDAGNTQGYFPTSYVVTEKASRAPSVQESPRDQQQQQQQALPPKSLRTQARRLSRSGDDRLAQQQQQQQKPVKTTRFNDTPVGESAA